MVVQDAPLVATDPALEALRYLASQCPTRRLIHELVEADVCRWPSMTAPERRLAFERALRRVAAVCPWVSSRGQIRKAARSMALAGA